MRSETAGVLYHRVFSRPPVRAIVAVLDRLIGDRHLELTEREVAVAGLHASAEGVRLLHVSDLHLTAEQGCPAEVARLAKKSAPDLVLYTGDFVNDEAGLPVLGRLLAEMPTGRGAYAVLGNHDHWALARVARRNDEAGLRRILSDHGVTVLDNDAAARPAEGLVLVGVDDPVTGFDDLARARAALDRAITDRSSSTVVLLVHTPDFVEELRGWCPDLVLCGHTHGGQVCMPGIGPLFRVSRLDRRQLSGLHRLTGVTTYVSRGVGFSGVDLRWRCPPELALLTLRASQPPRA